LGAGFLAVVAMVPAEDAAIDVERSVISIHVSKAGLLSAAGHDHWVSAPIASGAIGETAPMHVEFTVETAEMKVKTDPKVDAKTQTQIQKDMEEMTLETRKFSEIAFRSTRIDKLGDGLWKVEGNLSLHGLTKVVRLNVTRNGDSYSARTVLKQTDFGIKPISVGGGIVKVKNEVEIDFQIFIRQALH
jgi:polyisoprenoid-binding protein YceI